MELKEKMEKIDEDIWKFANNGMSEPAMEKYLNRNAEMVYATTTPDIIVVFSKKPQITLSLKRATITGVQGYDTKLVIHTNEAVCNKMYPKLWTKLHAKSWY